MLPQEFKNIITSKSYNKDIDLKDLDSITSSKSTGSFRTLFEFGLDNDIDYKTAWQGLNIEALGRGFNINKYNWNGKIEWRNDGTSHRVSSLIYHLFCDKKSYMVNANITEYSIDKIKLQEYINDWHIFLLHKKNTTSVTHLLRESGILKL